MLDIWMTLYYFVDHSCVLSGHRICGNFPFGRWLLGTLSEKAWPGLWRR